MAENWKRYKYRGIQQKVGDMEYEGVKMTCGQERVKKLMHHIGYKGTELREAVEEFGCCYYTTHNDRHFMHGQIEAVWCTKEESKKDNNDLYAVSILDARKQAGKKKTRYAREDKYIPN